MPADPTTARLIGAGPKAKRAVHDFYATPPECTEALIRAESGLLLRPIVEPCCGKGHISRVLRHHGAEVESSDLIPRGYGRSRVDFLKVRKPLVCKAVVTNPPFSLAADMVRHAMHLRAEKIAMLLKLQFLETAQRADLIEQCWEAHGYALVRVHVFVNRVALWRNGIPCKGGMLALGWYVWEKASSPQPTFLNRIEVR